MSFSTHCIGHFTTGSFMGRGNQYIQLVKILYCKLWTNGKQLLAFPLEVGLGFELRPQRWEARVLQYYLFREYGKHICFKCNRSFLTIIILNYHIKKFHTSRLHIISKRYILVKHMFNLC